MTLIVNRFPHASYDPQRQTGFLVYYYPYDAVNSGAFDIKQWRHETFSPEVLDYKEGRPEHIEYFVALFIELINHALRESKKNNAFLVPVPSSINHDNPLYSTILRKKGMRDSRNRDDRNIVFCHKLGEHDTRLQVADILYRVTAKPEKADWTPEQHKRSLDLKTILDRDANAAATFILVDDVMTHGGTMQGAKGILLYSWKISPPQL